MTDPKLLAEQQQRAELARLAKEDPTSTAAMAVSAMKHARDRYEKLISGDHYAGQLTKALNDISAAEKLERQTMARYQKFARDAKEAAKRNPPQDAPTEQNTFTDNLRQEHTADNGRPATTGTDPATEQPTTQDERANGVLAGAHDGEGSTRVDNVAA